MSILEQREKGSDGDISIITVVGNEILKVVTLGDIDFEGG